MIQTKRQASSSTSPSSRAEVEAERAEHARGDGRLVGGEEHGRAGLGAEARELLLGEELGDRRAHLPVLVEDEVREPLRPPLLRERLQPLQLRARERLRDADEPHAGAFAKTPNSEPRVASVASSISSPKRRSGLSLP